MGGQAGFKQWHNAKWRELWDAYGLGMNGFAWQVAYALQGQDRRTRHERADRARIGLTAYRNAA